MRVLVADDHPISRSGIEFLLSGEPDLDLVGSAADGDQVLELTAALAPDVVILDLILPKRPRLVVLEYLKRLHPCPRIVVISGQATGLSFRQALDSGADAIISKEDTSDEVLAARLGLEPRG